MKKCIIYTITLIFTYFVALHMHKWAVSSTMETIEIKEGLRFEHDGETVELVEWE
jgi:formate hydrogenlyase subunit 4